MTTKFVLDGYDLESKKAEAKAKVVEALGSAVSISGNTITVRYAVDNHKVTYILNAVGVSYSGG